MKSINAAKRKEAIAAYLFILPQLIGIIIFSIIPVAAVIALTFFDWNIVGIPKFVGLANYIEQFTSPDMRTALINTLYYIVLVIPAQLVLALLLAMALNHIKGKTFYRVIYYTPGVTSSVAACVCWMNLYNGDYGAVNLFLSKFGIHGPNWLVDTATVMPAIAVMSIWWGIGYYMILFLSGLQGISKSYYEAAQIDGASGISQFFHITLPMLSSTSFFIIIMAIIGSFQVFDQTFVMTGGGPAKASYTVVMYIYQNAFQFFNMGAASTSAFMLFAIILLVTLFQFKMQKKWVYYEG